MISIARPLMSARRRNHCGTVRRAANVFAALLCALAMGGGPATSAAREKIALTRLDGKVRIDIGGQLFTEYHYAKFAKPILYPIIGPHGIPMTRNYPMKEVAGEARDHVHQKSMWFTHGSVNGADFWGEGSESGRIEQEQMETSFTDERATITTRNRWVTPDGKVVCTDTRRLDFHTIPAGRVIDWSVTLHASEGDVVFGDTKEGTMGIRTNSRLRLRADPGRGVEVVTGNATNSRGDKQRDVWGKRAGWVDYWGEIDGQTVGIAIFDHPDNPRHPTWWHARDYGLIAANPFGVHDFEEKPPGTGAMKIAAGQSIRFRYRFVFHEGDVEQAAIQDLYEAYARRDDGQAQKTGSWRVLPEGRVLADRRLGPPKDLNGYFPFEPPGNLEEWEERAEEVRRRIQMAMGLWPMPPRRPPRAVVHGRVQREAYTVDKVYLQSYPGHYVTGNLYRPRGIEGPRPAVLSPHGHFRDGRFHDAGENEIRKQLVAGAERFAHAGRFPIQARCVQLARMGCIVFQYDMLGYADSRQIPRDVAHGYSDLRPEMESRQAWGFYSPQAELRLQNVMGLQTYNSLSALDWVANLPEVDAQRIAVTGASGGGTQTMILCAIDPRPAVSFPAVMVSTAMQGGCTCENAAYLRIGTGNVEFAGLVAPKPLGMTAADDWTREIMTKGLPELKQLYSLYDAQDKVMARALTHFPHNYNYVSRAVMYGWLNRHLDLGWEEPVVEEDFQPLSREELTVWNDDHPQPPGGPEYERELLQVMTRISDRQMSEIAPRDNESLGLFRGVVGAAVDTMVGRELPSPADVAFETFDELDQGDWLLYRGLLRNAAESEEFPLVHLHPKQWNGTLVLWFDGHGKSALWEGPEKLRDEIRDLLDAGMAVASADVLLQGEFLDKDERTEARNRKVDNPRDAAAYTLGYNPTLLARRVHDIMTAVSFATHREQAPQRLYLVGTAGAAPWVITAAVVVGDAVDAVAVDTQAFRFADLTSWRDEHFLPGAVKYGDLPGLLALIAPRKLWIGGERGQVPETVAAAYVAAGAQQNVTCPPSEGQRSRADAAQWLVGIAEP